MQPKKENNYFVRQKNEKISPSTKIYPLRILFLQCINSEAKQSLTTVSSRCWRGVRQWVLAHRKTSISRCRANENNMLWCFLGYYSASSLGSHPLLNHIQIYSQLSFSVCFHLFLIVPLFMSFKLCLNLPLLFSPGTLSFALPAISHLFDILQ